MNVKYKIGGIFLLLILQGACATSPAVDPVTDQATNKIAIDDGTQVVDAKNKRVCKELQSTGTRIAKKICQTQGAWDEMERIAQERLDNITKPQSNNPTGD
jgi:hypothetical protein